MHERALFRLRNLPTRMRGWLQGTTRNVGNLKLAAELQATLIRASGARVDYGVVSRRVVTTAGVGFITDAFQNLVELEAMNNHASGTGTTAEAVGDTALVTEVATRVVGTQSEPSANVYRTVATIPYLATLAITEHGVFSAAAAGVLLDRSVFSAINVVNGDSIQFTYSLTTTAGS